MKPTTKAFGIGLLVGILSPFLLAYCLLILEAFFYPNTSVTPEELFLPLELCLIGLLVSTLIVTWRAVGGGANLLYALGGFFTGLFPVANIIAGVVFLILTHKEEREEEKLEKREEGEGGAK